MKESNLGNGGSLDRKQRCLFVQMMELGGHAEKCQMVGTVAHHCS